MSYISYDHELAEKASAFWERMFMISMVCFVLSFFAMLISVWFDPPPTSGQWRQSSTWATAAFFVSVVFTLVASFRSEFLKRRLKSYEDKTLEG